MAISPGNPDEPLHELKHAPVPGYRKAFAVAFAAMGLYLLLILASSPGPAEHGHEKQDHGHEETNAPSSHENESAAH